jgi:DNA-binding response OmpR family regulator
MLIVDDDESMRRALAFYFEQRGYRVVTAPTMATAKQQFSSSRHWALVIADYDLPDGTGWDFCCWIRQRSRAVIPPFLLISGAAAASFFADRVEFLPKPFSVEQLDHYVAALVGRRSRSSCGNA